MPVRACSLKFRRQGNETRVWAYGRKRVVGAGRSAERGCVEDQPQPRRNEWRVGKISRLASCSSEVLICFSEVVATRIAVGCLRAAAAGLRHSRACMFKANRGTLTCASPSLHSYPIQGQGIASYFTLLHPWFFATKNGLENLGGRAVPPCQIGAGRRSPPRNNSVNSEAAGARGRSSGPARRKWCWPRRTRNG